MTVRMTDVDAGPSRFSYSTDRGHHWEGPFRLPLFGQAGIAARTDYVVNGPADCMLFLTAVEDQPQGRPAALRAHDRRRARPGGSSPGSARSREGSRSCPRPFGSATGSCSRPSAGTRATRHWIETYRSRDDGQSWTLDTVPAPDLGEGNPASLIRLADGRLCLTYGHRACAVLDPGPAQPRRRAHLGERDHAPRTTAAVATWDILAASSARTARS